MNNRVSCISAGAEWGLTAYGEPCSDPCKHRGFPYTWYVCILITAQLITY